MVQKERELHQQPSLNPVCHGDYAKTLNTANLAQFSDTDKLKAENFPILSMFVFEPKPKKKESIRLRRPTATRTTAPTATRRRKTTKTTTTKTTKKMGKACISGRVLPKQERDWMEDVTPETLEGVGKEYLQYLFDWSEPIPEPQFFIEIGGTPTLQVGEIAAIKGKAKMGKSQFEYLLCGSLIRGEKVGPIKPLRPVTKILFFDTEQGKPTIRKTLTRAAKYAKINPFVNDDRLMLFPLRYVKQDVRREIIQQAIIGEKPDVAIIDNARDLVRDFMKADESGDLVEWLKNLTEFGCTVIACVHENKSKDDSNMRGHLGTELMNELTDCYQVEKKDGRFVVSNAGSRDMPCPDLAFFINDAGEYVVDENPVQVEDGTLAEIDRNMKRCFEGEDSYTYTRLIWKYVEKSGRKEPTAKSHIKTATEKGIIRKEGKLYKLAI